MRTPVHRVPKVTGMVLGHLRRRPNADDATLPVTKGTQQPSPGMTLRHHHSPAHLLGVLNGLFDGWLRMPRSGHQSNSIVLLTTVKQAKRSWLLDERRTCVDSDCCCQLPAESQVQQLLLHCAECRPGGIDLLSLVSASFITSNYRGRAHEEVSDSGSDVSVSHHKSAGVAGLRVFNVGTSPRENARAAFRTSRAIFGFFRSAPNPPRFTCNLYAAHPEGFLKRRCSQ